jgi:hypothetical protein
MNELYINYSELLRRSTRFIKEPKEKNVFSIGAGGHYENPISDLLAFFLNPSEEHKLGKLFLESLFECIKINKHPILEIANVPSRENVTDKGNRIDILIEGIDWIIVIENKIFHRANNPFDDYENFVKGKYQGHEYYFILLSVKREIWPENWFHIQYGKFIEVVKKNLGFFSLQAKNNKWIVILREFILNLEEQIGGYTMNKKEINFIENNYTGIYALKNMIGRYIKYIGEKGLELIDTKTAKMIPQTWEEDQSALRFYDREQWNNESNIVIVLKPDGKIDLKFYIYINQKSNIETVHKHFNEDGIWYWWPEPNFSCYGNSKGKEFERLDDTFKEFKKIVQLFNTFYKKEIDY